MGRAIFSVIAGLVLAFIIITSFESLSHYLYPLPAGIGTQNTPLMREAMYNAPIEMYLLILTGYMLGAFAGGFMASFLSRKHHLRHALIVGLLLMLAGIANLVMLPHAPWFWLSALVYLPMVWLGGIIGKKSVRIPLTTEEENIL